mgnify:CR=1 FL=1
MTFLILFQHFFNFINYIFNIDNQRQSNNTVNILAIFL